MGIFVKNFSSRILFTANMQYTKACCTYANDGMGTNFDCLQFGTLSSSKGNPISKFAAQNGICGGGGLATNANKGVSAAVTANNQKTLCTKTQPFMINFQTDSQEIQTSEAMVAMKGFQLAWFQSSNNC